MKIARNQFSPLRVHLGVETLNLVYVRKVDFCLKVDWNFFKPRNNASSMFKNAESMYSYCLPYGRESQFDDSTYCWLLEEAVIQHGESNFTFLKSFFFRNQISEKIVKELRK
jgi:hypothetical protein